MASANIISKRLFESMNRKVEHRTSDFSVCINYSDFQVILGPYATLAAIKKLHMNFLEAEAKNDQSYVDYLIRLEKLRVYNKYQCNSEITQLGQNK